MDEPFDLDEGNWAATQEFTAKLTWRGEPTETFSDWKLTLHAEDTPGISLWCADAGSVEHLPQISGFHVHRAAKLCESPALGSTTAEVVSREEAIFPGPSC